MTYDEFEDQVDQYSRYLEGLRSARESVERAIRLVKDEPEYLYFEVWPDPDPQKVDPGWFEWLRGVKAREEDPPSDPWGIPQ